MSLKSETKLVIGMVGLPARGKVIKKIILTILFYRHLSQGK